MFPRGRLERLTPLVVALNDGAQGLIPEGLYPVDSVEMRMAPGDGPQGTGFEPTPD